MERNFNLSYKASLFANDIKENLALISKYKNKFHSKKYDNCSGENFVTGCISQHSPEN